MWKISRRAFIRLCAGVGVTAGLTALLGPRLLDLLADPDNPPVLWLQGAGCTGCTVSTLNGVEPAVEKVLQEVISLEYHPTLMAAAGGSALKHLFETAAAHPDGFYLVVEGGVPTATGGSFCTVGRLGGRHVTVLEALQRIGNSARAVLAAGSCAAYGGISAAHPNIAGVVGVGTVVEDAPVINIPNCPAHPDRLLGTLVYLLDYDVLPELDRFGRPVMFYGRTVHEECSRRRDYQHGRFARVIGEPGCLYQLGCKGYQAHVDCPERRWNGGTNWCVAAGAPCIACSEPGFPDAFSPFYAVSEAPPEGQIRLRRRRS